MGEGQWWVRSRLPTYSPEHLTQGGFHRRGFVGRVSVSAPAVTSCTLPVL